MALVKDRDKDVATDALVPTADRPNDHGPDKPARTRGASGFFTVYKKGQGYWTRMGTAIGAAVLIAVLALYTYSETKAFFQQSPRIPVISTVVVVAIGVIAAWVLMNKPRNADFLIATDGEMNKVNWTSRKELLGSTRIVIIFLFAIAFILFFIDVIAGLFFQIIGLLRIGPLF
jgi:preprotein translocase subunit SecE